MRVLSLKDVESCQLLFLYILTLINNMVVNEDLPFPVLFIAINFPYRTAFVSSIDFDTMCIFIRFKNILISNFFFVLLIVQVHGVLFPKITFYSLISGVTSLGLERNI